MTNVSRKGEDIRRYILEHVERHPNDIGKITAEHFGITRQGVNKYLQKLYSEQVLTKSGKTRGSAYKLAVLSEWRESFQITPNLAEDLVWTNSIRSVISSLPNNILDIWHYGFTEMFNNAIDHSGGSEILIVIKNNAVKTEMLLIDNGVGIFNKIKTELNLLDERHAIFELHKGKLTTDPKSHTGEGIFFTSRMFDSFDILSGGVFFSHKFGDDRDWILENDKFSTGTAVWMELNNHKARTMKSIFDKFTSKADYGFNRTVVPVRLAQYGDDKLISRSQAKRVLARVELFRIVIFDFKNVDYIGQAFADEIFRVFAQNHPNIELNVININPEIEKMIKRARNARVHGGS